MFVASWPSGLRRAVQVRISPGARVRTTPMSSVFFESIFGSIHLEEFLGVYEIN